MRTVVRKVEALRVHPCFQESCHGDYGRIHLPVAPRCNIQCAYCDRKYDCANESRPGVTSRVISPKEAVFRTREALIREPRIRVAGIAGPGEPLANPETMETLALLHESFPDLILCASSNGLLVEEKLPALLRAGLDTLTVTINAVTAAAAEQIYDGEKVDVERLLCQQRRALKLCRNTRLAVKVNTILIPGVNEREVEEIARLAAQEGAVRMNLTPLIPCGGMASFRAPTREELAWARSRAGRFISQFTLCRQCRADACGLV